LTPSCEPFLSRFENNVADYTAVLSAENNDEGLRLNGEKWMLLLARDQRFLPDEHLGLIVVDEEHKCHTTRSEPRYMPENRVMRRPLEISLFF
jgi:primosomal protein N'